MAAATSKNKEPFPYTLDTYLTTTLGNLKSSHFANLTIVLGNESCDLDSAVSAIVYAAYLFWQHYQIKCQVCTRHWRDESSYVDDIFVPILNVDRTDFDLKTEVVYCLREHGIDASKLVFRDDFDLQQLTTKSTTSVALVDHHVLAKRDKFLLPLVTEIIDHRPMDRHQWQYKEDTRSSIELVGSCCSMVTQRIRDLSALISKDVDFFKCFPTAADMLYCGIVLDTVNFSKEVNKATPVDRAMAEFLEGVLKPGDTEEYRKGKLERLVSARSDVSYLNTAQLVRKDVKVAGDVLVPSLPIRVEDFLQKPLAMAAVKQALTRFECSIAVLLGMSLRDGLSRDIAIYSADNEKAARLAAHLNQWKGPRFVLVAHEIPNMKEVLYYTQENLSASRKQYMPALMDFLEKAGKP